VISSVSLQSGVPAALSMTVAERIASVEAMLAESIAKRLY
jgi:hypothetical protein